MTNFPFKSWLKNISISRKLYFIVGTMVLLIFVQVYTLWYGLNTLSSIRSCINTESQWSNLQKDAVYRLLKYSRRFTESDYIEFMKLVSMVKADQSARTELLNKNPDFVFARKKFLEAGNDPEDAEGMSKIYWWYPHISYLQYANTMWNESDSVFYRLIPISMNLKQELISIYSSQEKISELRLQIDEINTRLSRYESRLSETLREGSRWLQSVILIILFCFSFTIQIAGVIMALFVSRWINKEINEVVKASKALSLGNFNYRAIVRSDDELGKLAGVFNSMTEKLRKIIEVEKSSEQKQFEIFLLARAEKKFRTALESAPFALVMINEKGTISLANKQAEQLFGYARIELIGKKIEMLLSPKSRTDFEQFCGNAFHHDDPDNNINGNEFIAMRKYNAEFIADIVLNPIETEEGTLLLCSVLDITKRKEYEMLLTESKEKAEKLSSAKQEFLSVISHEMRTPLNAITAITHLLKTEKHLPEQVENLNLLAFSAKNLLALINDILDLSKIESGKIQLEYIDFDFEDLINNVHDVLLHQAKEKHIDFNVTIDPEIPAVLIGDPVRISQVLSNLLHNAIKFTDEGEIILEVKRISGNENETQLLFSVSDTGIGIEKEKQEEIFESFSQAHPSITRQFGGTGLGLTISRKLVLMMGGHMAVQSELNEGTTFSFRLTLLNSKSERLRHRPRSESDYNLEGVNLLLVEDNATNQLLARKFISRWGASVDTADNGLEAVEKVREGKYDMVLMDLQMPVMNGYRANKLIRDMGFTHDKLPVIALTAYAMDNIKAKVLNAGMNDYLPKPIDPQELYHKIVSHLKRKSSDTSDFVIKALPEKVLNIEQLIESFDDKFKSEFLDMLEKEFLDFALKIERATHHNDLNRVRQLIHRLHPSLSRLAHENLSEQLTRLKAIMHDNPGDIESTNECIRKIKEESMLIIESIGRLKEKYLK